MARLTFSNFQSALRYYFASAFGFQNVDNAYHDIDNAKQITWSDSANVTSIGVVGLDVDSVCDYDHERKKGARQATLFQANLNGLIVTTAFYIADRNSVISSIEYVHATAGTDAGGLTAVVTHETGTQAAGTGAVVMTNTFNCQGTINTPQTATLLSVDGNGNVVSGLNMMPGDRLSVVFTGVTTALAGVALSVASYPGFKEQPAIYSMVANGSIANEAFFIANRDSVITGVNAFWGVAGTDAGTVTVDVTHETGTTAPAGGSSILSAALSVKTAANTVNSPALNATASRLKMAAGDRLSIKLTGTLTALANLIVVVYMQSSSGTVGVAIPYYGQIDIPFSLATPVTQVLFVADRDYEVIDASSIWSTAGSVSATYDFGIAKGTTVPGSATSVSTGAVSADTTANTASILPLSVSRRNRLLSQGDRLVLIMGGTLTSLAGFTSNVSLLPR